MECNKNGGITWVVKEFDTNFVIPKKKEPQKGMEMNLGNNHEQPSVVNNSYAADCSDNNIQSIPSELFSNQYEKYSQNQQKYPNYNMAVDQEQPKRQRTLKRASNHKEAPKNQETSAKYGDCYADMHDLSLPEELRKLLQPLNCKLCTAALNSKLNARVHYMSKNHQKKMKKWLIMHSLETGEPMHKRALGSETEKPLIVNDPMHFHCEVCDLALTGPLHAQQHYTGKSHEKAVRGGKTPAGKGFFNDDGKWIRTVAAKSDTTGRDGFGQGFILAPVGASASVAPKYDATGSIASELKCDICKVAVTSMGQMEAHIVGQKHKKKVKLLIEAEDARTKLLPKPSTEQDDLTNDDTFCFGVRGVAYSDNFLARFRTPSGHYYCKSCNLTLNSESQFIVHIQAKKHKKIFAVPK